MKFIDYGFERLAHLYDANKQHLESRGISFYSFVNHPQLLFTSAFTPRIDQQAEPDEHGFYPLLGRQVEVSRKIELADYLADRSYDFPASNSAVLRNGRLIEKINKRRQVGKKNSHKTKVKS